MDKSKLKKADIASVCLMGAASVLLLLSAFVNYDSPRPPVRALSYTASALFWLTLCAAWIIKAVLLSRIKKKEKTDRKPAIITFFSNKLAKIADIASVLLLIAVIVALAADFADTAQLIIISLFVFAFQMHIALNGKVYKYIYNK